MVDDWKTHLEELFVDARILEKSKGEVREKFDQFCEFIAEPAFESIAEELRRFDVKAKWVKTRGSSIHFQVNFPGTSVDNFHYILILPKNSITLSLSLMLKGRRTRRSPLEETVTPFMEELEENDVINLQKESLIMDFVERFRNFTFATLTSPE